MTSTIPLSARLFAILAIVAPLPLGSSRPLGWSALALATALCLLAWLWENRRPGGQPLVPVHRIAIPGVLYGAVLAWGMLQALPVLPQSWAHPVWELAEAALGPLSAAVSLTPSASFESVLRLATYAAAFFLALQLGRSRHRAAWIVETLAFGAIALAAYGVLEFLSGSETILWLDKWAYRGDLTATLVNRNHYATLAGLGLLCTVAALDRHLDLAGRSTLLRGVLSAGRHAWVLAAGVPLLMLALVLTGSRAGTAASVLGVAVLLVARRRLRRSEAVMVGLGVLAMGLASASLLSGRLALLGEDAPVRWAVYTTSMILLEQRPWLGSGLGSFADAFAAVRPVGMTQIWDRAHCDWLEMTVELGVPAASALFAALFWLAGRCLAGCLVRRRDRALPALGLAASALVGIHALVDFSLQIPAVAFTYAIMLGVAVAQSWPSREPSA